MSQVASPFGGRSAASVSEKTAYSTAVQTLTKYKRSFIFSARAETRCLLLRGLLSTSIAQNLLGLLFQHLSPPLNIIGGWAVVPSAVLYGSARKVSEIVQGNRYLTSSVARVQALPLQSSPNKAEEESKHSPLLRLHK